MNTYRVHITTGTTDLGTYDVTAADEWKARTRAMGIFLMSDRAADMPSGSSVDYSVTEL